MADKHSETLTYRLTIGLVTQDPAWASLLTQIGVSYEVVDFNSNNLAGDYSVIIVNGNPNRAQLKLLHRYRQNGGALLDCGSYHTFLDQVRLSRRYLSQILPAPDRRFHFVGRIDLFQKSYVHPDSSLLDQTVSLPSQNHERLAFLGWNIPNAIADTRTARKSFYTSDNGQPDEIASKVSRAPIRRTVAELLKQLHLSRDLPYIHRWHFPADYKHFFGFRIDTDFGTKESISSVYKLVQKHKLAITWFLHVSAHENWLDYFKDFPPNQEIAVHGYRHNTFLTYEKNYQNIEKALRILDRKGLATEGFCAPYGKWNKRLQRAIENLQFEYSSEFGYDYDNLPHYPIIDKHPSTVLQVPVHPIGTGRLKHAGASKEQIKSYYIQLINLQKSRHEPVILYHHPNQQGIDIFDEIIANLSGENLANWTMGKYAQWWKKRNRDEFLPQIRNNTVYFNNEGTASNVRAAVYTGPKKLALIRTDSSTELANLPTYSYDPGTPPVVRQQEKEHRWRYKLIKHGLLDFLNRSGLR